MHLTHKTPLDAVRGHLLASGIACEQRERSLWLPELGAELLPALHVGDFWSCADGFLRTLDDLDELCFLPRVDTPTRDKQLRRQYARAMAMDARRRGVPA
jgi:hypothetical protein